MEEKSFCAQDTWQQSVCGRCRGSAGITKAHTFQRSWRLDFSHQLLELPSVTLVGWERSGEWSSGWQKEERKTVFVFSSNYTKPILANCNLDYPYYGLLQQRVQPLVSKCGLKDAAVSGAWPSDIRKQEDQKKRRTALLWLRELGLIHTHSQVPDAAQDFANGCRDSLSLAASFPK